MCGSVKQLGCTRTLTQLWNGISNPMYNTKRFIVIRNDKVIFDRGGTLAYHVYSASKGLLGAPTLVHAMSRAGWGSPIRPPPGCPMATAPAGAPTTPGRTSPSSSWPGTPAGSATTATPAPSAAMRHPGWQAAYDKADGGGTKFVYPNDAFTIARAKAEQNREPAGPREHSSSTATSATAC